MNVSARLERLEERSAARPALESAAARGARLDALLEGLDAWRETCAAALALRGDPRGWEEWGSFRKFTQSVISGACAAPDLDVFTWWWSTLHRLHLALTCDAEARPFAVDDRDAPLERELMEALGADDYSTLRAVAIERSPWRDDSYPCPETFAGFYPELAELEAERDSWPPEERAQLEAMTDAQLEEAAAGRWPDDVLEKQSTETAGGDPPAGVA